MYWYSWITIIFRNITIQLYITTTIGIYCYNFGVYNYCCYNYNYTYLLYMFPWYYIVITIIPIPIVLTVIPIPIVMVRYNYWYITIAVTEQPLYNNMILITNIPIVIYNNNSYYHYISSLYNNMIVVESCTITIQRRHRISRLSLVGRRGHDTLLTRDSPPGRAGATRRGERAVPTLCNGSREIHGLSHRQAVVVRHDVC